MRVSEAMRQDIDAVGPEHSLREAARRMLASGAPVLPVQQDERLVGLVSRRDLAVRAPAEGRGAGSPVGDIMNRDVKYCFEDDDCREVRDNIGDHPVRRLPVVSRNGRLLGLLLLPELDDGDPRLDAALRCLIEQQAVEG